MPHCGRFKGIGSETASVVEATVRKGGLLAAGPLAVALQ